jgi:uncharacterized membrane protein YdjX (TVP38/TMEM64 family)
MGVLRARLLRRIREADVHGRFRIYYPTVPDLGEARLNVHAKLMIVDGRFVRIGSANLNNRSMGLDSECDLALEESGDGRVEDFAQRLLVDLLGEHLDVAPATVRAEHERTGSLIATIDALRGRARTLEPLDGAVAPWLESVVPDAAVVDPESPIPAAELQEMVAPLAATAPRQWPLLAGAAFLVAVVAAWFWTPLGEALDPQALLARLEPLRHSAWAPAVVAALFVAGGLLLVPVTLLIVVTAATFGPLLGGLLAMSGALLSAAAGYGIGRALGRQRVRRWFGSRLNHVGKRLSRHGVLVVAAVRLLPLAPYSVVNVAAGASDVGLRAFLLGTAIGMLPGIVGAAVFAEQLVRTLERPEPWNVVLLVALVAALLFVARWMERRLTGEPVRRSALAAAFRRFVRTPGTPEPSPRR